MKTRVFIVDDHALFRKGLSVMINSEPDMEICGEGEDCILATQNILRLKPDVAIVDISLKGTNGIELIKNIKAMEPGIQVVVLSMHDESIYALRVLRVGAKAYVMKQDSANTVVEAIRWVLKGHLYVSERVAGQMLNRYAQGEELGDDSPVGSLSDRELEVLNLIGSGISTREIAQRLNLSVKTIETHRAHLKTKLNLGSASQLVQFCVRWVEQNERLVPVDTNEPSAEEGERTPSLAPFPTVTAMAVNGSGGTKPVPIRAKMQSVLR